MISMKDVNLSKRMEAVVNMVSPQSFAIADVGCDHAYVSIALLQRDIAKKVIAMDVRTGPLDIAKRNIVQAGFLDVIDVRLGDGLQRLDVDEVDTIIIAGMGGLLIKGILERGIHILQDAKEKPVLILQPQSDLQEVRKFLYENAYSIAQEQMLVEEGKYYTIIKAQCCDEQSEPAYNEIEWVYGRCNLESRSACLLEYLKNEERVLHNIYMNLQKTVSGSDKEAVNEATLERLHSLSDEIELNKKALEYYNR